MRGLTMVLWLSIVAVLIAAVLFYIGPATSISVIKNTFGFQVAPASGPVSYTVLAHGSLALSLHERTNYRITTQDNFVQLWTMIYGVTDTTSLPNVDFTTHEVLALFDGSHSSSGYSISVDGVADYGGVRTVTISHGTLPESCHYAARASSPFVLIVVPKTTFSLAHQDLESAGICPSGGN
jgi:hypothetical protein